MLICDNFLSLNIDRLRATSLTRLRIRDHYTSSTLIVGKGEAGPSSLHIMLEGAMECKDGCKVSMDAHMASHG